MFLSTLTVSSHPGRTDANGGHWDRKSGTYHFHAGEYAGKGGGGSSNSEYIPFTPPYEPPTDNPYKSDKKIEAVSNADSSIKEILENILTIGICIWCIGVFICFDLKKSDGCLTFGISVILIAYLIDYLIEEKPELFFGLILITIMIIPLIMKLKKKYTVVKLDINEYLNSFCKLRNHYEELLKIEKQITTFDDINIPDLYEIGSDNLPKDKKSISDWGKSFTLYKTDRGIKLHIKYNCCSATKPLHIYHCYYYRDFSELLCKKCATDYVIPDMSWYKNYLKYNQAISKRQSIENNCNNLKKKIKDLHKKCNSIKTKILIMFSKKNKKALQEANEKYKEIW